MKNILGPHDGNHDYLTQKKAQNYQVISISMIVTKN